MPSEHVIKSTKRLLRLIRSRERAMMQVQTNNDRLWAAHTDMCQAGGKAHVMPTHKYELSGNCTWWLFIASGDSFFFDWVEPPAEPENPEIGQRLYAAHRREYTVVPRLRIINKAIAKELGFTVDHADSNYLR